MENHIGEIRDLYALFSLSNPGLIQPYKSRIAPQHIVAAKLVAAIHTFDAATTITTIDNNKYSFALDLTCRTYQSKGNWIWITQIEIIYPEKLLMTIPVSARVIDIPYAGSKICAHWLFRSIDIELSETLNNQL
jgi:hypothetical protein